MTKENAVRTLQIVCPNVCRKKADPNRVKFTDTTVKYIKPEKERAIYWCETLTGFGLRVTPKGTKTWIYVYRLDGPTKTFTLGRYPKMTLRQARTEYLKEKEQVELGFDPSNKVIDRGESYTVKRLVDKYLEDSQDRGKKYWKKEFYAFNKDLIPALGNKKAHLVTPEDLMSVFTAIIKKRKALSAARHLYKYTNSLFNYAGTARINKMRRRDNPCLDIDIGIQHQSRDRHLSPKEIYRFWHGVDQMNALPVVKLALKFLLCTATRSSEVRKFKKKHFEKTDNIWTLPKTKNGKLHRVYLPQLAKSLMEEAHSLNEESEYVFGSPRPKRLSDRKDGLLTDCVFSHAVRLNFEVFGIDETFRPHDLRRTAATLIAALFGDRKFAKLALNHSERGATEVYDKYIYDRERKLGLEALNFAIEKIVSSKSVESVPSLDMIRDEAHAKGLLFLQPMSLSDKKQDFQTTLPSPVSYTLSASLNV